jgi:anti-anti-sigma factor
MLDVQLEPFQSDGVSEILLDLREVTFIDSSGLHALIRASERAEDAGKRLVVTGLGPLARRVLEITGTEHLLTTTV